MWDAGMSTTQINDPPLGFSPKVKNASALAVLVNIENSVPRTAS